LKLSHRLSRLYFQTAFILFRVQSSFRDEFFATLFLDQSKKTLRGVIIPGLTFCSCRRRVLIVTIESAKIMKQRTPRLHALNCAEKPSSSCVACNTPRVNSFWKKNSGMITWRTKAMSDAADRTTFNPFNPQPRVSQSSTQSNDRSPFR